jgi:TetR/AcrR family transcriptional regulator, regulator of cefoperazone and chloramphenicol sensitivity
VTDNGPRGQETRQRLLETGIRMFAEHGFNKVTVRDIAHAAGANLAAVNYHFGDKFGLYMAVLQLAVQEMRKHSDATMQARAGSTAAERLRHYIGMHVRLLISLDPGAWIFRIMMHEMAEPTQAMEWIVEHGFHPRIRYLKGLVTELLGTTEDDPRVLRCAIAVHSQFLFCRPDKFRTLAFGDTLPRNDTQIDELIDHITTFSLAGIAAIAQPHGSTGPIFTTSKSLP